MVKNLEALKDHLTARLKATVELMGKDGVVLVGESWQNDLVKSLLEETDLQVDNVVKETPFDNYVAAIESAEGANLAIVSTIDRENHLLFRNYNKRYEMGYDIYPFADLYTSEVLALSGTDDGPTEAEGYLRTVDKFFNNTSGGAFFELKRLVEGTPLGSEEFIANLVEYGKIEEKSAHKMNGSIVTIKCRGPENAGLVE
jgi:hypothetical protein